MGGLSNKVGNLEKSKRKDKIFLLQNVYNILWQIMSLKQK